MQSYAYTQWSDNTLKPSVHKKVTNAAWEKTLLQTHTMVWLKQKNETFQICNAFEKNVFHTDVQWLHKLCKIMFYNGLG